MQSGDPPGPKEQQNPKEQPAAQNSASSDPLAPPDLPGISLTTPALSRGPYSAVYRGWDRTQRQDVIVKVLQTNGDPVAADRFRREASVMAKLRHPNIVALYSFFDGNPSALVMEYVAGQTLGDLIGAHGPLTADRAAEIMEEIAAALDCIHAENVVHRDVKPSNILLPKHGPARLTDFGVAHIDSSAPLTIQGDMLGTIEYASPEQVKGTSVPDTRSDVYSLAAVAYFALAGTPPFPAADSTMQSQLSVMHQQVFSEPPALRFHRTDLTPGIDAAVRRGLAKAPEDRYPSAGQFASALRSAVLAASDAPAAAAAAAPRRPYALSGALAGLALLAGAAVLVLDREHSANPPISSVTPSPGPLASRPSAAGPSLSAPSSAPVALPPSVQTAAHPAPAHLPAAKPKQVAALPPSKPKQVAALPPRAVPSKPKQARVAAAYAPHAHAVPIFRPVHHAHPLLTAHTPLPVHHALAAPVRVAKRSVRERPKFRRLPSLVAARQKPLPVHLASAKTASVELASSKLASPKPSAGLAWLSVYAKQDVLSARGRAQAQTIPAREVWVDGHLLPSLASGGWAAVPAGKHLVAFVPAGQSGFGRSPGVWVSLAPGAHVSRQILLPAASPLLATTPAPPAPELTASAAPPSPAVLPPPALTPQLNSVPAPTLAASPVGWYTVSGWIVRNPAAPKPDLVRTSAYWVKVDGTPNLALSLGQWTELPAGKHTIQFQPTNGVGVGPKTWDIDLAPQNHLDQHIPLPPVDAAPQ